MKSLRHQHFERLLSSCTSSNDRSDRIIASKEQNHHNNNNIKKGHFEEDDEDEGGGGVRRGTVLSYKVQPSLSGSETDLSTSTSTENLTHEEKYVLRNSTRQEPQGEETLEVEAGIQLGGSCSRSHHSKYTSMDQSSCNTLIIHRDDRETDEDDDDDGDDDEDMERDYDRKTTGGSRYGAAMTTTSSKRWDSSTHSLPMMGSANTNHFKGYYEVQEQQQQQKRRFSGPVVDSGSSYVRHSNQTQSYLNQSTNSDNTKTMSKEAPSLTTVHQVTSSIASSTPIVSSTHYTKGRESSQSDLEMNRIDFDLSKLPPPPEYPKWLQTELSASAEMGITTTTDTMMTSVGCGGGGFGVGRTTAPVVSYSTVSPLSRSQPDLSSLGRWGEDGCGGFRRNHYLSHRPRTKGKASPEVSPALLHHHRRATYDAVRYCAKEEIDVRDVKVEMLIEGLMNENRQLKYELESSYYKVFKLQKFEAEIQKVHQAHEELVKSSQKREELEQKIKAKLQLELRRQQEFNKDLKVHLTKQCQPSAVSDVMESKREMQHRDAFVAQLIQQNKELIAAKERHEIELAAQRATLQEQRTHIEILDSALTNAQANVVKLEEECRKKQAYVERVIQLQRALTSLQVASERRDEMAKTLRGQLEKDIQELRNQLRRQQQANQQQQSSEGGGHCNNEQTNGNKGGRGSGMSLADTEAQEDNVDELKRIAREKEERIIALETEVSKWEQRYLEENAMRQIAIDAASMPKDAKIAALERTSQESEKLIAQARSDKLKHMDELHVANKHCADLDAKIKDLESRLAERDAMIKVLQKHSIDKDAAYQNVMMRSPRHTPHPSFHAITSSSISTVCIATAATTSTSNSRGNSLSGITIASSPIVTCPSEDAPSPSSVASSSMSDVSASKESLDEQLKKLDSQLLSKDSIIQALRSEKEKYPSHYWMV